MALDESVLGKPRDEAHAFELLTRLMGRRHRVITGIAVADCRDLAVRSAAVETWVTMRDASSDEIRDYVATGECLDKAGAYALQGEAGRRFVERVEGSRSNVIGLPIDETLALLSAARQAREQNGAAAQSSAKRGSRKEDRPGDTGGAREGSGGDMTANSTSDTTRGQGTR